VVVSLHQVDIAMKYCPRVVALNQGQVVFDGPSSALTPELLHALYGVQAEELLRPAGPAATEGASVHVLPQPAVVSWATRPAKAA